MAYQLFRRRWRKNRGNFVPILMYHSISPENGASPHPYYTVNTTEDVFRSHMHFLKKQGYSSVGLESLIGDSSFERTEKQVIITFDDGFRDFNSAAFPILRELGFTATVFLPTKFIGRASPGLRDKYHLSWEEVRMLADQGIEFGSHTSTHVHLVNVNVDRIPHELTESKKTIEDKIGRRVRFFSYPYGFPDHRKKFTAALRAMLIEAGYDCCVTTKIGSVNVGDDRYSLRRIPANSFDDEEFFKAKLNGAYDWLNTPQYVLKNMKMILNIKQRDPTFL
jgi:peptidoglycan/xylan/chitin deacetylase (PgdA/CDA1 family)